jgi:putative Mg2+ transporter-C (MgtC) family protein
MEIYIDYTIRLALSLVCGFCLGLERKMRQHTVGIRTLTLLCVSSCLLTIVSTAIASTGVVKGDPARVAAAVITGIGFLGAGAIVNQGLNIRGLTSAAIIFTSAALGVACGAKLYIPVAVVLCFSFLLLLVIGPMERKLFPAEKRKIIKLDFSTDKVDEAAVRTILIDFGIIIFELNTRYDKQSGGMTLCYIGKIPENLATVELTQKLAALPDIKAVSVDN